MSHLRRNLCCILSLPLLFSKSLEPTLARARDEDRPELSVALTAPCNPSPFPPSYPNHCRTRGSGGHGIDEYQSAAPGCEASSSTSGHCALRPVTRCPQ
jgi:hypothetical protein